MNKIVIYFERCKGCYLCTEACPKKIIEVGYRPNIAGCYPVSMISGGECIACALCALVCPDAAIEVFKGLKDDED